MVVVHLLVVVHFWLLFTFGGFTFGGFTFGGFTFCGSTFRGFIFHQIRMTVTGGITKKRYILYDTPRHALVAPAVCGLVREAFAAFCDSFARHRRSSCDDSEEDVAGATAAGGGEGGGGGGSGVVPPEGGGGEDAEGDAEEGAPGRDAQPGALIGPDKD